VKLAQKLVLVVKSLEVWNFSSAVGELQMPTHVSAKGRRDRVDRNLDWRNRNSSS